MNALTMTLGTLLILLPALVALRAWRAPGPRFRIRDRVGGLAELLLLAALLGTCREVIAWPTISTLPWVLGVSLTALAAAGVAWRFPEQPWWRARKRRWPRILRLAFGVPLAAIVLAFTTGG